MAQAANNLTGVPIPSIDWKESNLFETYRKFKRQCECIFRGPLAAAEDEVKIQYLKLWIGPDGMDICDGWNLTGDDLNSLETHWARFDSHVRPKSNFRVARFQLRAVKQNAGESIDAYVTRVKIILEQCRYRERDDMLLDTLIAGVHDESVQRKLISKDETLTLDKALDIIRSYESTKSQMSDISETRQVHAIQRKGRGRGDRRNKGNKQNGDEKGKRGPESNEMAPGACWNCGNAHSRGERCPAANVTCHGCDKLGHFQRMCISTGAKVVPKKTGGPRMSKVHDVQESTATADDFFGFDVISVNTLERSIQQDNQAFANVVMMTGNKQVSVRCKIDTGAQSNVMPFTVYAKLFPGATTDVQLPCTHHRLTAYGGQDIKHYGQSQIQCRHGSTRLTIPFYVTQASSPTILGLGACTKLGLVTLNCDKTCRLCHSSSDVHDITQPDTTHSDPKHPSNSPYGNKCDAKEDVLRREPECFSHGDIGAGFPGDPYHMVMSADAEPCVRPPHRIPEALKKPFKETLDKMVAEDVICQVDQPTDWVSNVVCVTKSNGDLRICLDPRDLNRSLKREHHYMPTLDDVLPKLTDAQVFSILDVRHGYWNVRLDEESQLLTTFNTPYGRYCFKRLPFGIVTAQDVFQKKMDQAFERVSGTVGIADDLVIFGKDHEEHDANLYEALQCAKRNNLKFNISKCFVKQDRIKFYGHYLSKEGLEVDIDKIQAVRDMPVPRTCQELQSFLGLVNYMSRFTPRLATITAPLRDLTKQDVVFEWHPEHQQAFDKLKDLISSPETLAFFDGSKPVTIQTDASQRGVGAALMQDGRPVAYASKSLSETESNYSNIEREMLAVVFGLERFRYYVYGRKVNIESDHRPLESIVKKRISSAPPRLQRMLLKVQPYDFELHYRPGKDIPVADALSRAPIPGDTIPDMDVLIHEVTNTSTSRLEQIRTLTRQDPQLILLANIIQHGWPNQRSECPSEIHDFWNYRDELSVHDGIIVKGARIVIPAALQKEVLNLLHEGHQGIVKCRLRARSSVFWPSLNKAIDDLIKQCSSCQYNAKSQSSEPLLHIESEQPWKTVGSDIFFWDGNNYVIVVDYYSSFPIIRKLSTTTSTSLVNSLRSIFAEYGVPETVISDNGPQYSSHEFAVFASKYGFKHTTSSPHFPQANGKAERYVGAVKDILTKTLQAKGDAHMALLCMRTTPIGPKLPSPAELIFGRKIQANLPTFNTYRQEDEVGDALRQLRAVEDRTPRRPLPDLTPGQSVRIQDPVSKKWHPGIVETKEEEPRSYLIKKPNGAILRRNRKHIRTTGETFHHPPLPDDETDEPVLHSQDETPTITSPVTQATDNQTHITAQTADDTGNRTATTADGANYITKFGRPVKPVVKMNL